MPDPRQQLLSRVLTSRQFAHADTLKRILRYLCERSTDTSVAPPKEYDIAIQAMGRAESFDPRTDPIVRVSIGSIRERLIAYFATEGRHELLRLTIPKGQYGAVFSEVSKENGAGKRVTPVPALTRFWGSYLNSSAPTSLVYTEPLFFRDDDGHYFRDWRINDATSSPQQFQASLIKAGYKPLQPSYHYLSTGELHCILSLSRMFHEMQSPVETRNARVSSWHELRASNLILLGSPRTNPFVQSLQGDDVFLTTVDHIENRAPFPGEHSSYAGRRYQDGQLMRMTEYAVVTRRPGLIPGTVVTLIAANHGRAIEGAGHLLTLEDRVQQTIAAMGMEDGELPDHFQILLQVETIDTDDQVLSVECIAHRALGGQPNSPPAP